MPSILLLGATGLVGSHLILELHEKYPNFPVTALVRNTSIDDYLTTTARVARIVHGDFSDHAKLSALAEEHDIVMNVGSSGDESVTVAILDGLKKRPVESKTVFIHMSGTGNFMDLRWKDGDHHDEARVWNDDSIEDMIAINASMFNAGAAARVLALNETHPHIATYVVFPSAIFGESVGPTRVFGEFQSLMYAKVKELGFVPYIGSGSAVANQIHVKAIIPFTLKILALSQESDQPTGSAYERTFIIGGPDKTWKEVAEVYAKAAFKKGIVAEPEAKSVTMEEAGAPGIQLVLACDMTFVGPRAKRMGFKYDQPDYAEYVQAGGDVA